jgi:hypothetical protein
VTQIAALPLIVVSWPLYPAPWKRKPPQMLGPAFFCHGQQFSANKRPPNFIHAVH